MSVNAQIELEGLTETAGAVTDLGQAVVGLEPISDQLEKAFGALQANLDSLTKQVDKQIASAADAAKRAEKAKEESAEKQAQAENQRLQSKMASLIGGGVNFTNYELQLQKLRDQQELVKDAEEKRLITSREALSALTKQRYQYAKLLAEAKAYGLVGGGTLGKIAAGVTQKLTSVPEQAAGAVKSQISGIGTGLMGLMSGLPIAGGLFGLMLYGVTNRDRINAETGEIVNIASAMGGKLTSAGSGFLGSFQQQAEHYFGISRQEFQGILTTFKDAGLTINDVLAKQSSNLGLVGKNILTLTLGIDKHFELAAGTSARGVVSLVTDYGMALKEAGDTYEKLAFQGARSGMGVQNFVTTVMQGAGALRQYGVSVENVAVVLTKLQERYEELGMPKQLAGTQAGMALGQISQGMSSMGTSMQSYFGERMGMGTGLEARMNFREGATRLASGGGSNEFMTDFIKQARQVAMEAGHGDTTQARYFLEQQGFGFEGAKGIIEIGDKFSKGQKLQDLSVGEQKKLREAFMTEGQKQSEMQKAQHTLMQKMAGVGEGLLQIVTNLVGYGIVFFKTFPTLLAGSDEEKRAVKDKLHEFNSGMLAGAAKMWSGGKGMAQGTYDLIKPMIGPLETALSWDPSVTHQGANTFEIEQAGKKAFESADTAVGMTIRGMQAASKVATARGHEGAGQALEGAAALYSGLTQASDRVASFISSGLGFGPTEGTRKRLEAEAHERLRQEESAEKVRKTQRQYEEDHKLQIKPEDEPKVLKVIARPAPGVTRPQTQ